MVTIDTGYAPNLIRFDIHPEKCKDAIEPFPDPQMCGASVTTLKFRGVLLIYFTMRDSETRVYIGVVDDLPCLCLLGRSFICRFVC